MTKKEKKLKTLKPQGLGPSQPQHSVSVVSGTPAPPAAALVLRNRTWVIFRFISLYILHDWIIALLAFVNES